MYPIDPSVDVTSFIGERLIEISVYERQIGFFFGNQNRISVDDGPIVLKLDRLRVEFYANTLPSKLFSLIGKDVISINLSENRQDLTFVFQGDGSLKIIGDLYYEGYELIIDGKVHTV